PSGHAFPLQVWGRRLSGERCRANGKRIAPAIRSPTSRRAERESAMSDHIRTGRDGAVLTVTFENPARRNAIDMAALDRLEALAGEIASDAGLRAVILTGAGDRAFTSGFDLTELAASTSTD